MKVTEEMLSTSSLLAGSAKGKQRFPWKAGKKILVISGLNFLTFPCTFTFIWRISFELYVGPTALLLAVSHWRLEILLHIFGGMMQIPFLSPPLCGFPLLFQVPAVMGFCFLLLIYFSSFKFFPPPPPASAIYILFPPVPFFPSFSYHFSAWLFSWSCLLRGQLYFFFGKIYGWCH